MSYTVTEEKSNNSVNSRLDSELEAKVRRSTERICENLHIIANEPSLALYRISEHVRKALPPTVESRCEVRRLNQLLVGAHLDAEDGINNVQAMDKAFPTFKRIEELLKKAIVLQQQSKHEPQRRVKKDTKGGGGGTLYQRFSVHLPSVDIPDLADFKETARETANRVESAISKEKQPTHKACTRSKSELGPHGYRSQGSFGPAEIQGPSTGEVQGPSPGSQVGPGGQGLTGLVEENVITGETKDGSFAAPQQDSCFAARDVAAAAAEGRVAAAPESNSSS